MNNLYHGSHAWLGDWINDSLWAIEEERYKGLVVRSKSTAWAGISKFLHAVAGEKYTFSCYVKVPSALGINIYLYHSNDFQAVARFSVSQLTFLNLPVGVWTRVSITAVCTQSGSVRPRVEARTDGVKLYVCGYQFEVGELTDYSLPLISNRTAADVSILKSLEGRIKAGAATVDEVQQYLAGDNKGAYNASDLNRVESAIQYLVKRLGEMGYPLNLVIFTAWTKESKPNSEDLARYFRNIATLRAILPAVYEFTPQVPEVDLATFTYEKANDLEKILLDIEEILQKTAASWFYLGEINAGEG